MFKYVRLTKGIMSSNTYIIWSPSGIAAVIDPGNPTDDIVKVLNDNNLMLKYIIMTHVHLDHIFYLEPLCSLYPDAVTVCHKDDLPGFSNPTFNASKLFGSGKIYADAKLCVIDGDIIELDEGYSIEVIHTPGHSPGSMSLLAGMILYTGDTLFYDGFGRTDLGYGSVKDLAKSIDRLYSMDDDLIVMPGHGTKSTIGRERVSNPFMEW